MTIIIKQFKKYVLQMTMGNGKNYPLSIINYPL